MFLKNHCIKKTIFFYLYVLCLTMTLTACQSEKDELLLEQVEEQTEQATKEEVTTMATLIYVYVCGEVKHPDVYALKPDARVNDVVKQAGGFLEKADKNGVNLAQKVSDGEQIYIPKIGEQTEQRIGSSIQEEAVSSQSDQKIDLNLATKEQLMTLTGIGEAKADAILNYRQEHGKFQTIEELKEIRGIKDGVFQKIKELIIVR